MLLMMGRETTEACWATHKRQAINLWNCCILLVDSFESYDNEWTCESQTENSICHRQRWGMSHLCLHWLHGCWSVQEKFCYEIGILSDYTYDRQAAVAVNNVKVLHLQIRSTEMQYLLQWFLLIFGSEYWKQIWMESIKKWNFEFCQNVVFRYWLLVKYVKCMALFVLYLRCQIIWRSWIRAS